MSESITITDPPLELPIARLLTGRGFITGKSGSGKSNTAGVVVEGILDAGYAVCIIDTDGEYHGLKSAYEVLHVGADEACDLQVGPEHAEKLAELALDHNVPIVLDVSGYLEAEEARAMIEATARHLFNREKRAQKPLLLVVEEMHEYVPEGVGLDACGQMLVRIAKRGRKRGLGLCGISQRPANVKKDVITQANWLVWHRLTWENDTDVVRRVVSSKTAEHIATLEDGEALVQADWLSEKHHRVQFDRKTTFDAGATPGLGNTQRPNLKSVSSEIVEELQTITEERRERENTVAQLRTKIERLEATIEEQKRELGRARDLSAMAEQFTQALTAGGGPTPENVQQAVDEIRDEKNEEIRSLRGERDELQGELARLREKAKTWREQAEVAEDLQHLRDHWEEAHEAYARLGSALSIENGRKVKRLKRHIRRLQVQFEENGAVEPKRKAVDQYGDFLEDEAVQAAIGEAKADDRTSARYVRGVIASLLQSESAVTYDEVAANLGIESTSHVSRAVTVLDEYGVVKKARDGRFTCVRFNTDGIAEIRGKARRRVRTAELMESI